MSSIMLLQEDKKKKKQTSVSAPVQYRWESRQQLKSEQAPNTVLIILHGNDSN